MYRLKFYLETTTTPRGTIPQIVATYFDIPSVTSPGVTLIVNDVPPPPDAIARIVLTPASSSLKATFSEQLTATAFNATDGVEPATFTWSSNSPAASVTNGAVHGLSVGTAQIVASAQTTGPNSSTITVTSNAAIVNVSAAPVLTTVTVNPASINVPEFSTTQFSAVGIDQYNNPVIPQPSFTWQSSSDVFATVDPGTGLVTALTPGVSSITATANPGVSGIGTVIIGQIYSMQGPWEFTTSDGLYTIEAELRNTVTSGTSLVSAPVQVMNPSRLQVVFLDSAFGLQQDASGNYLHNDFWFGPAITMSGSNASNKITLSFANSGGSGISINGQLSPQGSGLAFSGNYTISSPSGPISGTLTGRQVAQAKTVWGSSLGAHVYGACGWAQGQSPITNMTFSSLSAMTLDWASGGLTCNSGTSALSNVEQIGAYLHFYGGSFSFTGYLDAVFGRLIIRDDACYAVANPSLCGGGGTM